MNMVDDLFCFTFFKLFELTEFPLCDKILQNDVILLIQDIKIFFEYITNNDGFCVKTCVLKFKQIKYDFDELSNFLPLTKIRNIFKNITNIFYKFIDIYTSNELTILSNFHCGHLIGIEYNNCIQTYKDNNIIACLCYKEFEKHIQILKKYDYFVHIIEKLRLFFIEIIKSVSNRKIYNSNVKHKIELLQEFIKIYNDEY